MSLIRVRMADLDNQASMILIPLDAESGDPLPELEPIRLQYYPETLQYSRGSIGWQEQQIPGLSHALVSWTGNGSPTLSFEAVFTRDNDPAWDVRSIERVGQRVKRHNHVYDVDMNAAAAWFVACSNPRYDSAIDARRPVSPPPVIQVVPEYVTNEDRAKSIASSFGAPDPASLISNVPLFQGAEATAFRGVTLSHQTRDFYGVMTSVSVNYEAFFTSGAPRVMRVSLSFNEVIQLGNAILPHSREQTARLAALYEITAKG